MTDVPDQTAEQAQSRSPGEQQASRHAVSQAPVESSTEAGEEARLPGGPGDVVADGQPAAEPAGDAPTIGEEVQLAAVLEAVLLVTDVPVPAVTLAQVVERPTGEVEATLARIAQEYNEQGRGFELRQVAGGWRLYTRADCAPYVERFVLDGQQARLTQAALETLAVVAYRQPVTRQRVSAVRGVNVDGVVRTLLARGLIAEAGPDDETGATRYRTTAYFLERLGLQSLEQLPSLAPLLPELDDMNIDSAST